MKLRTMTAICMEILGGFKHRDIANKYGVSPSTVSIFKHRLEKEGFYKGIDGCRALSELSESELARRIYPGMIDLKDGDVIIVGRAKPDTYIPDFKEIANEVIDAKVTRKFCFNEYLDKCESIGKKPVSSSDFYAKLGNELKKLKGAKIYMTQDHPYGYEVCIDYCGQTWPYFDSKQHLRHGSVFVMTWAASYMTFAMVVPGQTTKCTCEAIGKAFQYFGYIPYNLQFDNGTAAVVKHTVGAETIFNDSFHHYMKHFKVSVTTSNPYSPTEKSCVEAMVNMVQNNVLPAISHDPHLSLEEVNRQLIGLVDKYINKAKFRNDSTRTREYLFKTYEIAKSRKLEGTIPEFYEHIPFIKVGLDYTVKVKGERYSVPYQYAGEYVSASICGNQLKICHDLKEIATHTITNDGTNHIKLEHMPENHREVALKRLMYPNFKSLMDAALKISQPLARFCDCMVKRYGFENGKKGCIRIINCYRKKQYINSFIDEAIDRMLSGEPQKWNSNTLLSIYEEVQKEAVYNGGKVYHQSEFDFCSDPNLAHLRSAETQKDSKAETASKDISNELDLNYGE